MARYVVRFMKDVLGDYGRACEICQCTLEVEADDETRAAEIAKKRFCDMNALRDWSLHADRLKISAADFPS